jgi:glyoxylase-like metal-dependent hydrolase (beta-lactamase superfamily II)
MASRRLNQITEHVYWLPPDSATDRPVLGAIVGQNGTLVVDAGNSPAHANLLKGELERIGAPAPKFLALTHSHWDHWFGISAFDIPALSSLETQRNLVELSQLDWSDQALDERVEAGLEIAFCRDMIRKELPERSGLVLRAPDIVFSDWMEVNLGGVTCRLVHVGGDHASDSSIACVLQEGVVFLSDCLNADIYHTHPGYTPKGVTALIERLRLCPGEHYFWGHGQEPMQREELEDFLSLLETTAALVEGGLVERQALLQAVEARMGRELVEYDEEDVQPFIAGYRV